MRTAAIHIYRRFTSSSGITSKIDSYVDNKPNTRLSESLLDIYKVGSPKDLNSRLEVFSQAVDIRYSDFAERYICDDMIHDILMKYHTDIDGMTFSKVVKMGVRNPDFSRTMTAVDLVLRSGMIGKFSCEEACELVECIAENRERLKKLQSFDYKTVLEKIFVHLTMKLANQTIQYEDLNHILNAISVYEDFLPRDLNMEFVADLKQTVLIELNRVTP